MDLEIKKAVISDAEIVYNILHLCGEHLKDRFDLTHWSPPYPLESIKNNIEQRDVYLVYKEDKSIATFTIGLNPLVFYDPNRWQVKATQAMYLNRLAVLPNLQGQNLGAWCMEKVENFARQASCQAIRFDGINHNKLITFYLKLGYKDLGLWQLQDARGVSWDVVLFEKAI